jgi:hypothetical protein
VQLSSKSGAILQDIDFSHFIIGGSTVKADIFSLNGQNAIRWSGGIIRIY